MTFGMQTDETTADAILGRFLEFGGEEIDTAYDYGKGATEEMLGRLLTQNRRDRVALATKANPWTDGGLQPGSVRHQLETSLRRLKTERVALFYLHAPDNRTPVEDTLRECQQLFVEGKFEGLGLSNYAAWQVVDICHLCRENGWVQPTVYQGMYNGVTRSIEVELLPALRAFGLAFFAYNPLAGGLLTGKYGDLAQQPQKGRFKLWDIYQERYWKKTYFEALEAISAACQATQAALADAALRWVLFHSELNDVYGDALILGASGPDQLTTNLASSVNGPLPEELKSAFVQAWELARPGCPPYFRT